MHEEEEFRHSDEKFEDYEEVAYVPARTKPRTSIFSVRLAAGELSILDEAAHSRGVSIGEFIRQAALREATGEDPATLGLRRLMAEVERAGGHLAIVSNTGDIRDLDRPA